MNLEQIQAFNFKVGDKFLYEYHTTDHGIILCVGLIRSIDGRTIRFLDVDAADIDFMGTEAMTFDDIFIGDNNLILTKLQVPSLLSLAQQAHTEYFI